MTQNTPDILASICERTKQTISSDMTKVSLIDIKSACIDAPAVRGFKNTLTKSTETGYGLIAEIKKASPSAGLIRPDFFPEKLAQEYKNGGASCLSVLTDEPYFQGSKDYLFQAQNAVNLPILRKDFIIDEYQIYQSRSWGADCILLIVGCLSNEQLIKFENLAFELDMDVLIEVHDENELNRALKYTTSTLLGINNRNLKVMKTDLSTTKLLVSLITDNSRTVISESGLKTKDDLDCMSSVGVKRFLVGEHLMRSNNVENATIFLLTGNKIYN